MERIHWQDWTMILVGAATAALPYLVTYTLPEGLSANLVVTAFVVTGAVVVVLGGIGAFSDFSWQEWLTALLGVWLVAMPWAVGFASSMPLVYGSVAAGLALMVLAGLALRAIAGDARS